MALDTVQHYLTRAREILLDESVPYRYSDQDLVDGLNFAFMEARRLRPELVFGYLRTPVPDFTTSALAAAVPIDVQYRVSFVYYMCGHVQLRDDDETGQESRAAAFLNKFTSQMLKIES